MTMNNPFPDWAIGSRTHRRKIQEQEDHCKRLMQRIKALEEYLAQSEAEKRHYKRAAESLLKIILEEADEEVDDIDLF